MTILLRSAHSIRRNIRIPSHLLPGYRHRSARTARKARSARSAPRLDPIEAIHRRIVVGKTLIWSCIVINGVVFTLWHYAGWPIKPVSTQAVDIYMKDNFLLSTIHIKSGHYWTVITSAFSHIDPPHFLFNMLNLHVFSMTMLDSLKVAPRHLAALMLGSSICGSLGFLYKEEHQQKDRITVGLGASGMTLGLGAAAAMLLPTHRLLLMGVVPIPMWALFLGYTAIDAYNINDSQSRIGHAAHLGGAAFGVVYYALFLRRFGGVFSFRRF